MMAVFCVQCGSQDLNTGLRCVKCGTQNTGHWGDGQTPCNVEVRMTPKPMSADTMETAMTDEQIKHMTNRFLCWKMPIESMSPDGGISIARPNYAPNVPWDVYGTNLLGYTEAEAMVRHMLDGMPE